MLRQKLHLLLMFLLVLFSLSAMAQSQQDSSDYNLNETMGAYIDANIGYARNNWSSFTNDGHGAFFFLSKTPGVNKNGAFTLGGDVGYQFWRYLALEFGAFYISSVNGEQLEISTPYYYVAGKVIIPLFGNLALIGKGGFTYRVINYAGDGQSAPYAGGYHLIKGVYGTGLQYHFNKNFLVSAQWLQMPEYTSGSNNSRGSAKQIPTLNQIFIGLGYLFTV